MVTITYFSVIFACPRQLLEEIPSKRVLCPELLDRWVGSSEKMIRGLFKDAEAELAACNGDATKSALHVIVIDEIDAVFRKRSSSEDSGETTRASAVNQVRSEEVLLKRRCILYDFNLFAESINQSINLFYYLDSCKA